MLWASLGCDTPPARAKKASSPLPVLTSIGVDTRLQTVNQVQMVLVKGGRYRPFYGTDSLLTDVASFEMDIHPVTQAQFKRFIDQNPEWRKSQIAPLRADASYLQSWSSDTEFGANLLPKAPATYISWFAAKAYCTCMGKRLPTVDEWEFAAMADETSRDGRRKAQNYKRSLAWYERPTPATLPEVMQNERNVWGIYDLHGLIWEWTQDFNSVMLSGESRKDNKVDDRGLFCSGGSVGATDLMNYAAFMRYAFRGSLKAQYTAKTLGFRCVKSPQIPFKKTSS